MVSFEAGRGDPCALTDTAPTPCAQGHPLHTHVRIQCCRVVWRSGNADPCGRVEAAMPRFAVDQYRALTFLKRRPDGRAETMMVAQGFSLALLKDLIRAGLVTAKTESAGRKTPIRIVRLRITESGRKALLRANRRQNEHTGQNIFGYLTIHSAAKEYKIADALQDRIVARRDG